MTFGQNVSPSHWEGDLHQFFYILYIRIRLGILLSGPTHAFGVIALKCVTFGQNISLSHWGGDLHQFFYILYIRIRLGILLSGPTHTFGVNALQPRNGQ